MQTQALGQTERAGRRRNVSLWRGLGFQLTVPSQSLLKAAPACHRDLIPGR